MTKTTSTHISDRATRTQERSASQENEQLAPSPVDCRLDLRHEAFETRVLNSQIAMPGHPPIADTTVRTMGDLLEAITAESDPNIIIIACCTRSYFTEQIVHYVRHQAIQPHVPDRRPQVPDDSFLRTSRPPEDHPAEIESHPAATAEGIESGHQQISTVQNTQSRLLSATLDVLLAAKNIGLCYCANLQNFRAFLPTIALRRGSSASNQTSLFVIDMLGLHHGTSEYTVQGLSRSFATLASVAHQTAWKTVEMVECVDICDRQDPRRGPRLWDAEVPLLNGSVKIGEAGHVWASRTVSIKAVARRWFQFR